VRRSTCRRPQPRHLRGTGPAPPGLRPARSGSRTLSVTFRSDVPHGPTPP
jgi:hypothetical protein